MNQKKDKPIGILDSGLGGLTVLRELERLLPAESLVYFGDNANCPYGNRPKEEILELSFAMLDFLRDRDVKIAAIACNTISTLTDWLQERYQFPIVSIIDVACEDIASMELDQIGVFATEFTVRQGHYERLIGKLRPETQVFSLPNHDLAKLIDEGQFDDPAVKAEVEALLGSLRQAQPELKDIVLGCTHYPIVQELFEQAAPGFNFINPALAQAKAVQVLLSERSQLREAVTAPIDIFTSGEKRQYEAALKKLEFSRPVTIHTHK